MPVTVEAEFRTDDSLKKYLAEGAELEVNGDKFRIVKSVKTAGRDPQGNRDTSTVSIIGLLSACHPVAFVRDRPIIKENSTLAEIYRATGATIKSIDADFSVPRFNCMIGQVPSFAIAKVLQEDGGVVRWKAGKLKFFRLSDLFRQTPAMTIADNADENVQSEFINRHEIPRFYSTDETGAIVQGNRSKARTARYQPFANELRLHNMTRCLVRRKVAKVAFSNRLAAGDLVSLAGSNKTLAIVTAAHVFLGGSDGGNAQQYSRLWLYDQQT